MSNRTKAEKLIYDVMDALDPSKAMSEHYKKKFSKMNDKEFKKFISYKFPYRFQPRLFKIEPNMDKINNAANILGIPITEKVNLPYLYENSDGVPVQSKECPVVYIHLKKMKQFITKKNSTPTGIDNRDMKSGLLVSFDKGVA